MNHRHLLDLFSKGVHEATAEQLDYLGAVIRDAWQTKLGRDFPRRVVTVSFERGSPDDLLGYVITFWQPANRSKA